MKQLGCRLLGEPVKSCECVQQKTKPKKIKRKEPRRGKFPTERTKWHSRFTIHEWLAVVLSVCHLCLCYDHHHHHHRRSIYWRGRIPCSLSSDRSSLLRLLHLPHVLSFVRPRLAFQLSALRSTLPSQREHSVRSPISKTCRLVHLAWTRRLTTRCCPPKFDPSSPLRRCRLRRSSLRSPVPTAQASCIGSRASWHVVT